MRKKKKGKERRVRENMAKRRDTGIFQRGKIFWIRYSFNGKQVRESTHSTKRDDAKLLLGGD